MQLIEKKTGKPKAIRLNPVVIEIIERRRVERPGDVWLFQVDCNRAKHKPISRIWGLGINGTENRFKRW